MSTNMSRVMADVKLLVDAFKYMYAEESFSQETFSATHTLLSQNELAQDCFEVNGGLQIVLSIAKDCNKEEVQKDALFTLATAVENNCKSQKVLLDPKVFKFIRNNLSAKSIDIRTTTAFLLLCLASNNGVGQDLARNTKCVHKLCELFKEAVPCRTSSDQPDQQWFERIDSKSQEMWPTVCSAICSTLVNPNNVENQRICCSLFPAATRVLRSGVNRQLLRPTITLLGACVMGNPECQTRLRIVGGLRAAVELLRSCLVREGSEYSAQEMDFIAHLVSTLGSTYGGHASNRSEVGELGVVSLLLQCLSINHLHGNEMVNFRTQCVLALISAVDSCERNQQLFLENQGLPQLVDLLTHSQNQEFKKLAMGVLHCCVVVQPSGQSEPMQEDVVTKTWSSVCAEKERCMETVLRASPEKETGQKTGSNSTSPHSCDQQKSAQFVWPSSHGLGKHENLFLAIKKQHELVGKLENKISELERRKKDKESTDGVGENRMAEQFSHAPRNSLVDAEVCVSRSTQTDFSYDSTDYDDYDHESGYDEMIPGSEDDSSDCYQDCDGMF